LQSDSGWVLRFHDPRRFGSLHWTEADPASHPLLAKLAPEPLERGLRRGVSVSRHAQTRVAIKQFIMNSQLVVGVGNIYASEACFARVSPRRRAAASPGRRPQGSPRPSRGAGEAIKSAARRLRDYVNADGSPGISPEAYSCTNARSSACRVCKSPIKQFVQGQRSTYWCDLPTLPALSGPWRSA
jgi:formamidopyrimidine-DNA glycosylase